MEKSLKGKELGKNISQRKDGRYQARFINRFGHRPYMQRRLMRLGQGCGKNNAMM